MATTPSPFSRHALIDARKRLGLSQEQLARKANLCRFTLVFIENGRTRTPQKATARKLARALKIRLAELYLAESQT